MAIGLGRAAFGECQRGFSHTSRTSSRIFWPEITRKLGHQYGLAYRVGQALYAGGLSATQYTTHNSARTPYRNWVNLRADKEYRLGPFRVDAILEVNNLLNKRNVRAINSETGDTVGLGRERDLNPSAYGVGRSIIFGLGIEW